MFEATIDVQRQCPHPNQSPEPVMTFHHTDAVEVDCPWFDPTWVLDHPEFPLAASLVAEEKEEP
ncbi:MAG: hypothetical protein JO246_15320 [Frankiaceae bacterium]|nr:hypothetical protein [Frankiaceae bacterium]MBV9869349.1 hypothetical protein [Frankiaceae bacterium]